MASSSKTHRGPFQKCHQIDLFVTVPNGVTQGIQARNRLVLGQGNQPQKNQPHVTLITIWADGTTPMAKIFGRDRFFNVVETGFKRHLESVQLVNLPGSYHIMGSRPNPFVAKGYTTSDNDKGAITGFRLEIYKWIEQVTGSNGVRGVKETGMDGKEYYVYRYNGLTIAVPDFYHGVGVWTPHVSFFNLGDVKVHQPALYDQFQNMTDRQIIVEVNRRFAKVHGSHPMGDFRLGDGPCLVVSNGQGTGRKIRTIQL